jgi:hypothetical protein
MRLTQILSLVFLVATCEVAAWKWPWEDSPECNEYDEGDASKTWSMQFYKKKNCEDIIGRIDSTDEGYKPNKCHKLPSGIHSIHGVAHGKYVLTWYQDDDCSNLHFLAATYRGKLVQKKSLKTPEKELSAAFAYSPQSFMVTDNYKNPGIPYPQYMNCENNDFDAQKHTTNACEKLKQKCSKAKKGQCPSSKLPPTYTGGIGGTHCLVTGNQMYKWFKGYCKEKKGYKCVREAMFTGDGAGGDLRFIPCNDPQPAIRFGEHRIPFLGRRWGKSFSCFSIVNVFTY